MPDPSFASLHNPFLCFSAQSILCINPTKAMLLLSAGGRS